MNRIARYLDQQDAWELPVTLGEADDDVASYSYDAHGNRVPSDDTTDVFTFDGRHVEPLQWNIMRHFDPTVGQWMSEDPVGFAGDDENMRRYVGE